MDNDEPHSIFKWALGDALGVDPEEISDATADDVLAYARSRAHGR